MAWKTTILVLKTTIYEMFIDRDQDDIAVRPLAHCTITHYSPIAPSLHISGLRAVAEPERLGTTRFHGQVLRSFMFKMKREPVKDYLNEFFKFLRMFR